MSRGSPKWTEIHLNDGMSSERHFESRAAKECKPVDRGFVKESGAVLERAFELFPGTLPPDRSWPGGDWPLTGGFDPEWLEIVLGSILTQNTRWENVEKTIPRLKSAGLVNLDTLNRCPARKLEDAIRPAGFFRQKATVIKGIAGFFVNRPTPEVPLERESLLGLKGIGPETADSILLYGFGRLEFVADAYSRRLLRRLGIVESEIGYEKAKRLIESVLKDDIQRYKSLHALIVQHAKQICRKRPLCELCPLTGLCRTYLSAGKRDGV